MLVYISRQIQNHVLIEMLQSLDQFQVTGRGRDFYFTVYSIQVLKGDLPGFILDLFSGAVRTLESRPKVGKIVHIYLKLT